MFTILMWAVFGLVVGWISKLLYPGDEEPAGILGTIGVGVVGSFVGGFINSLLTGHMEIGPSGFLMSILGAVLFLFVYGRMKKK